MQAFSTVSLALILSVACSKAEPEKSPSKAAKSTPTKVARAEQPKPAEKPVAAVPDGPLAIRRVHSKGQTYTLRFERSDERLKVAWLATAEVLDTTDGITSLGIHILSITSQVTGKAQKRSSTNIRVRVEIQDGSHDARVISTDSNLVEAGDLTAFEEMAGDLCQPTTEPHEANSTWQSDDARKHTYAGITEVDGLQLITYKHEHRSENMDMDCEAQVAIDDGYAGTRAVTTTLRLGKGIPPRPLKSSLTIRRL